ncbi:MAG: ComEC/Rec2 family competence protein, partial [Acetobacteraceae bacterium]
MLWLPVAMGAGVLVYFTLRFEPPGWLGVTVAAALMPGVVFLRGREAWPIAGTRVVLTLLVAAAIGFAAAQLATARALPLETLPRRAVMITGTVHLVELLPQGRRVTLAHARLGDAPALRRLVRVRLRDTDPATIVEGDQIAVRALVRAPSPPFYPGGWDLQRGAFFAGLAGYGFAIGPVRVIAHHAPSGVSGMLERLRETIAVRFQAALPGAPGAIAATLFTGEQTAIPERDREAFRGSGLAHLLAVAGLHIGIVMGLMFGAVRIALAGWEYAALRWQAKPIATLVALAAGGFYMLLTGMHVPIMRSFAMAGLVAVAVLAGRRAISLRGLALAATVLILVAPQEVPGVSFQMSFSAVLALIAGYEALRPRLTALHGNGTRWRRGALYMAGLALTSLLAGGASAPFAAYHFGRVQIYFVLANMIAVPITALWVMPAGLVALALLPLGAERLALVPMGWGIRAILWVARTTTALPHAVIAVGPMPGWGLAVLALGMAWLGLWRGRWRLAGLLAVAVGVISPTLIRSADVLVADNGAMVAVRTAGGVFVARGRGSSRFTLGEWEQYWAAGPARRIELDGTQAGGAVACDAVSCLLRPRASGTAVLLMSASGRRGAGEERTAACVAVTIVAPAALGVRPGEAAPGSQAGTTARLAAPVRPLVRPLARSLARSSADPAANPTVERRYSPASAIARCPAPLRIDPRRLGRDGATAIWLDRHGARMET